MDEYEKSQLDSAKRAGIIDAENRLDVERATNQAFGELVLSIGRGDKGGPRSVMWNQSLYMFKLGLLCAEANRKTRKKKP